MEDLYGYRMFCFYFYNRWLCVFDNGTSVDILVSSLTTWNIVYSKVNYMDKKIQIIKTAR